MDIELLDIPGLSASDQTACKIKALSVNGKSPALAALSEWEAGERADYNKIFKNLRILGQLGRQVNNDKRVQKCGNSKYSETYEVRADKGHARLMFFWCVDDSVVILTNKFWKGGQQNLAFKQCSDFRDIYFNHKP